MDEGRVGSTCREQPKGVGNDRRACREQPKGVLGTGQVRVEHLGGGGRIRNGGGSWRRRFGLGATVSMCSKLARHARHKVDGGLGCRLAIGDNSGV